MINISIHFCAYFNAATKQQNANQLIYECVMAYGLIWSHFTASESDTSVFLMISFSAIHWKRGYSRRFWIKLFKERCFNFFYDVPVWPNSPLKYSTVVIHCFVSWLREFKWCKMCRRIFVAGSVLHDISYVKIYSNATFFLSSNKISKICG